MHIIVWRPTDKLLHVSIQIDAMIVIMCDAVNLHLLLHERINGLLVYAVSFMLFACDDVDDDERRHVAVYIARV